MSKTKIKEYAFEYILNIVYILCFLYFLLFTSNKMGMALSIFCIFTSIVLYYLKNKKIILSKSLYYVCNLFILFASLLGSGFGFYNINHYDDFLHIWSGFVGAAIAYNLYEVLIKDDESISKIFLVIYLFMFSMGVAALWEMSEYLLDTFLGLKTQAGGLTDSMIDIIDCFIGSIVMVIYYIKSKLTKEERKD